MWRRPSRGRGCSPPASRPTRPAIQTPGSTRTCHLTPRHGFHYKTVPHITLKSIAQNKGLDPIFARHESILAERLTALNAALEAHAKAQSREGEELRRKLAGKLLAKLRESARSVTDADERRWILPGTDPQLFQAAKGGPTAKQVADLRAFASARPAQWQEWEVPFDTDPIGRSRCKPR